MPLGYRLDTAWIPLDATGIPPGYRLDTARMSLGCCWGAVWIPPGYRLDTAGIPFGYRLYTGYRLDPVWIPFGLDTLWLDPLGTYGWVEQAALKRAEEAFPETVERLRELCAFGPRDGKACADKVGGC